MVILLFKFDGVVKTLHLRRYYKILDTSTLQIIFLKKNKEII